MKSNPQPNPQRRHIGRLLFVTLAAAGLGGLATALMLSYGQQPVSAEPAIPPGVSMQSWFENGQGGRHVLQIFEGSAPPVGVRVSGVVATDTDCDPDAKGLSHCHNRIDLASGRSITVIHTHFMSRNPCLQPGQRVSITGLNANWVVAYEGQPPRVN